MNKIVSPMFACTVCGLKTPPGLEVVLPPTVMTMVFAEVNKRKDSQAMKMTEYMFGKYRGREYTARSKQSLEKEWVSSFYHPQLMAEVTSRMAQ